MTVYILFSSVGSDAGPFNLYSNVDGYASPFALNVPKATLLAGYPSASVPDGTTIVRAKSVGACTNATDLPVIPVAPTTPPPTTAPPTTAPPTTAPPTTTSSTTVAPLPFNANLTFTDFTGACASVFDTYAYQSVDVEGTHFWSDAAMTIPIESGTDYFKWFDGVTSHAVKTSAPDGVVTGVVNCDEI